MPVTALSHNSLTGIELHEDKRIKQPVRAASTGNITIASPGSSLDGVALVAGDRVLLKDQTSATQNGIYVWAAAASALVRSSDAGVSTDFGFGFQVYVREGVINSGSIWLFTQTAAFTLNTTAVTFAKLNATGYVTSVAVTAPAEFAVTGSPINGGAGSIAITKANQPANQVMAGPSGGAAAPPTFRAIVPADVPVMGASGAAHAAGLVGDPGVVAGATRYWREDGAFAVPPGTAGGSGTVTSVALTAPAEFSVTGSPVTGAGTLAIAKANQSANQVYAGPASGVAAAPTFRTIVPADVPVMVASGASHAAGLVPDPGATAGTTRYLSEAGTFTIPAGSGGGGGASGGGSGALVPIQVVGPLTAAQATMAFNSIPQTGYRNLRVVWQARGDVAAAAANIQAQFNADTGANYDRQLMYSNGSTVSAVESLGQTAAAIGEISGANAPTSSAGSGELHIPGYTGTTYRKSARAVSARKAADSSTNFEAAVWVIEWRNTAAITSIVLTPSAGNFAAGAYACLYGEMDTAGPLLTPASNLLSETILTAAQATISIPTIPQGYRDLQIVVQGRSTSASILNVTAQFNGDTGANYDYENGYFSGSSTNAPSQTFGATSANIGSVSGTGATAANAGEFQAFIPNYSGTAFNKALQSFGSRNDTEGSGGITAELYTAHWRSTAAISSILLGLSAAGNFATGTAVRVYGLPVAAGGASVGTGTRLRISANQSVPTATATALAWDTEDSDADNQHYTSAAALTGTVAKTAGSATLAGTGTLFTTELSVGQAISVPGTAAEVVVVIAIASATSLTVAGAGFANTATGQTATRVNTAVVFRQPGFYTLEANIYSAALSAGLTTMQYRLNGTTIIGQIDEGGINASAAYDLVAQRPFQQWDYVELLWTQNSGGAVNVLADERTHWSIGARPTVIVAVPYVRLVDQKAQNTAGGTFTSGADQQRTLALDVDSGGIAAVASNQVTLPAGTYEYAVSAPGYQCGSHQAFLYNVTDAVEVKRGTTETSGATSATTTQSTINGRVTLNGSKVLEVRHRCTTTSATNGLGLPANFGTEVYTIAEFHKVG